MSCFLQLQFGHQMENNTEPPEICEAQDSSSSNNHTADSREDLAATKARYHRHTEQQIEKMNKLFCECTHPNENQRQILSQDVGLTTRQIKFWFQNRRTHEKISQERLEHERLKEENSKLKVENYILQMALMSSKESNCCVCDGSLAANMTNELRCLHMENTRLKEKIIDLRNDSQLHHIPTPVEPSLGLGIGSNTGYDEPPMASSSCMIPFTAILPEFVGVSLPESEKVRALDLAMTAAHQLLRMAQGGEPLWLMAGQGDNEILNMEEYYNAFPEWTVTASRRSIGDPRIEASRDRTMVSSNPATIVRSFLDVKAWMEMFPSIVAQARIVEVIAAGVGDMGNGSLQLMNAEFQLPPPLVGARELYFLRSCNYLEMEGLWVVVDFPLDGLNYTVHGGAAASSNGYRRFPSGLVIRDLSDGRSEVTWVEHAEIEDRALYQIILNEPVFTGRTFGARRWTERLSAYFDLMIEKLMNQSAMHGAGINSTM